VVLRPKNIGNPKKKKICENCIRAKKNPKYCLSHVELFTFKNDTSRQMSSKPGELIGRVM
jgi:hypothetical protein